jgi:hypothetical protein
LLANWLQNDTFIFDKCVFKVSDYKMNFKTHIFPKETEEASFIVVTDTLDVFVLHAANLPNVDTTLGEHQKFLQTPIQGAIPLNQPWCQQLIDLRSVTDFYIFDDLLTDHCFSFKDIMLELYKVESKKFYDYVKVIDELKKTGDNNVQN